MVESHVGTLPLVIPGDVVELVEGMEELYVMGTVDGFQKVTKIDGLQDMASLTVSERGREGTCCCSAAAIRVRTYEMLRGTSGCVATLCCHYYARAAMLCPVVQVVL